MSLIFTPKITYSFDALKYDSGIKAKHSKVSVEVREYNNWSAKDLTMMVNLKAIGMSYRDIGRHLHRSQDSCSLTLSRNELGVCYKGIRNKLINEILCKDCV